MKVTTDVVPAIYKMGERFAQLVIVPIPEIEVVETEELTPSDRNEGGFGSTDIDSAAEGNSPEQVQPSEEVEKPAED